MEVAQEILDEAQFSQFFRSLRQAGAEAQGAYREQADFLRGEVLPKAKENYALGEQEYAWRLRNDFGIQESPAQLYQRGIELTKQIWERMEALVTQINHTKDLRGVLEDLRKEHPRDDQELLKIYQAVAERAKKFVNEKRPFTNQWC